MKTFLFLTKPKEEPEKAKTNRGIPWCCGKSTQAADRIWVYLTGGQGISYEWRAISHSRQDPTGRHRYVCDVEFVCDFIPPITIVELKNAIPKTEWKPLYQLRGFKAIKIPDRIAEKIIALRPARPLSDVEQRFSEDVAASLELTSGERLKKLASAPKYPAKSKVTTEVFNRSPHIVAAVLIAAGGICERCKCPAPFLKASNGKPYLEVHHKRPLADGGEDTVENAEALCPNCHRKAHYG
jgi:5-methylcytosine-specific restriction protein A